MAYKNLDEGHQFVGICKVPDGGDSILSVFRILQRVTSRKRETAENVVSHAADPTHRTSYAYLGNNPSQDTHQDVLPLLAV